MRQPQTYSGPQGVEAAACRNKSFPGVGNAPRILIWPVTGSEGDRRRGNRSLGLPRGESTKISSENLMTAGFELVDDGIKAMWNPDDEKKPNA